MTEPERIAIERLKGSAYWTVEFTLSVPSASGHPYRANRSVEIIAADVHRALALFIATYPDADVWVIRKTGNGKEILIDRGAVPTYDAASTADSNATAILQGLDVVIRP